MFGSSGIRGVAGRDLTGPLCYRVAQAIGTTCLAPGSRVCLATDTRVSRHAISEAVIHGLRSTGIHVDEMGILPTPVLAFAAARCSRDGAPYHAGIMITASHNPAEFNGIKLFNGNGTGIGFSREQETAIEQTLRAGRFRKAAPGRLARDRTAGGRYRRFLRSRFPRLAGAYGMRIVVDAGNGAAAGFASRLFSTMGLDVVPLNDHPDGTFPGRPPEPDESTLDGTVRFLRRKQAHLALCFDGDADRIVFADSEGPLGLNEMIAFISRLEVMRTRRKRVATSVEAGGLLDLALSDLGAEVVRDKVGDCNVAHLTRGIGAAIGVEPAGVYIMPETGLYPDSMLAALTLLEQTGDPGEIRGFLKALPRLYFLQDKVPCPNRAKARVMSAIMGRASGFEMPHAATTDGLRLRSEEAWLLIRASGTEPVIRVSAESTSAAHAEELMDLGKRALASTMAEVTGA